MGVKGLKVTDQNQLDKTLKEFVNTEGPVLLEVKVEKKVSVLPMVPAGKGLDEFIYFDPEVEKEQNELRHKRTNGKF